MLIGAARCGTTSLHAYLGRHPKVYLCTPKEPEFFSRDAVYERGMDWYASLFADAPDGCFLGEASTTYSRWPHTLDSPRLIAEVVPAVKLLYIVRNPTDRAYSHYAHQMRDGVSSTFEEMLDQRPEYIDCGLYLTQIERFLEHFARDQLHIVLLDDFKVDRVAELRGMQSFLGLDNRDLTGSGEIRMNISGADHYVWSQTIGKVRRVPGLSHLVNIAPPRWRAWVAQRVTRSRTARTLAEEYHLPPMLPETRAMLVDRFREPNRTLARFLGRDLSSWDR